MTKEEIGKIRFVFQSHLSLEDEHCTTYIAEQNSHKFGICKHVPYKDGKPKGRAYSHYMVDGVVFNTKRKFYDFCAQL